MTGSTVLYWGLYVHYALFSLSYSRSLYMLFIFFTVFTVFCVGQSSNSFIDIIVWGVSVYYGWRSFDSNQVSLKESKDYIKLHLSEFTERLSSAAHASLRIHGNCLSEFPDEDDIETVPEHQKQRTHCWTELSSRSISLVGIGNAGVLRMNLASTKFCKNEFDVFLQLLCFALHYCSLYWLSYGVIFFIDYNKEEPN